MHRLTHTHTSFVTHLLISDEASKFLPTELIPASIAKGANKSNPNTSSYLTFSTHPFHSPTNESFKHIL